MANVETDEKNVFTVTDVKTGGINGRYDIPISRRFQFQENYNVKNNILCQSSANNLVLCGIYDPAQGLDFLNSMPNNRQGTGNSDYSWNGFPGLQK